MNRADRIRRRPQLEQLESLVPLSAAAAALHHAAAVPAAVARPQDGSLQGTVRGVFVRTGGDPNTGATYQITTSGRLNPIGQTSDQAKIQTTGPGLTGLVNSSMTIRNSKGSMKISLDGADVTGTPGQLAYTFISGTRAYQNVSASGLIDVSLGSVSTSRGGSIRLTFHA